MQNSLAREATLKLGRYTLETLFRHYFARLKRDLARGAAAGTSSLRQEELLYDEVFFIVKMFLRSASHHSVEDVQAFGNMGTPAPPWVYVLRVVVPRSCCDDAAEYVVTALGGAEQTKSVVGGTKWWQVRGVDGVNAQWIIARKDYQEAKKRFKASKEGAGRRSTTHASEDSGAHSDSLPAGGPSPDDDDDGDGGDDGEGGDMAELPSSLWQEMDQMPCILYFHGGAYYFGSTDQERPSISRLARKIKGRVLGVDYRLSPQYPFPCALQDAIAAYLYLIRPPPAALHSPVPPARIVVAGDSAGAGLALALLQTLRDTGLPAPGGAILVSPWCDLTHSFPSVHTNMETDIMPPWGVSFQSPSTLWPPPPEELANKVHETMRSRLRSMLVPSEDARIPKPSAARHHFFGSHPSLVDMALSTAPPGHVDVGAAASQPAASEAPREGAQTVRVRTKEGAELVIEDQVHMYAQNSVLAHPLVSPALGYLGGLPPLLWVAGDAEVLRDEIIYTAHKAADPSKYPVSEAARRMCPVLKGIEERYGPTPCHLQVYDHAAHVLPILFPFTTPSKYCFRAMALFTKYVVDAPHSANPQASGSFGASASDWSSPRFTSSPWVGSPGPGIPRSQSPDVSPRASSDTSVFSSPSSPTVNGAAPSPRTPDSLPRRVKPASEGHAAERPRSSSGSPLHFSISSPTDFLRRSFALSPKRSQFPAEHDKERGALRQQRSHSLPGAQRETRDGRGKEESEDVGGPRFAQGRPDSERADGERFAGEPVVYSETVEFPPMKERMIRERVSIRGVVRPLEPESELPAFGVPPELVGVLSELVVRRYLDARRKFDRKFARSAHLIEKYRHRNIARANKDTLRNMAQLQGHLSARASADAAPPAPPPPGDPISGPALEQPLPHHGLAEGLLSASGTWTWAWALDASERPPPSSIVARRDTAEARRLARVADEAVLQGDGVSGNSLWAVLVEHLTAAPGRKSTPNGHAAAHSPTPTSRFQRLRLRRSERQAASLP